MSNDPSSFDGGVDVRAGAAAVRERDVGPSMAGLSLDAGG
jgi:hypothetical protein